MNVTIYKNLSENNKADKELQQLGITQSVFLKQSTSIISPVLILNIDLAEISNANYLYIEDFKRYYFIEDITSINATTVQISARCDTLSTFIDEIRENHAIISRQENTYNLYLNDSIFKTYANPIIQTKKFPNSFGNVNYVLMTAGK